MASFLIFRVALFTKRKSAARIYPNLQWPVPRSNSCGPRWNTATRHPVLHPPKPWTWPRLVLMSRNAETKKVACCPWCGNSWKFGDFIFPPIYLSAASLVTNRRASRALTAPCQHSSAYQLSDENKIGVWGLDAWRFKGIWLVHFTAFPSFVIMNDLQKSGHTEEWA